MVNDQKDQVVERPHLKRLYDGCVLDVYWHDGKFFVQEMCDIYFEQEFSPEQLIELGNELIALAKSKMETQE